MTDLPDPTWRLLLSRGLPTFALEGILPVLLFSVATPLALYGSAFQAGDDVEIPAADMPAGVPEWMRSLENWAERSGSNSETKRGTIVVTVPTDARPWDS